VVVPKIIDAQGLLFRVRLSDYGWSAALWEKIVAAYPYAVNYDPGSRALPHDELSAQLVRDSTGTEVPYVQADWFFAHVSRPPLYHQVLGLPDTLAELQATLSLDVQADIAANHVARSGFNDSGLSRFNRVIERHPNIAEGPTFWLTYDFSAGTDTSNVLVHPLDFVWGSSEVLFSLPNGLYGFMVVDAQGKRLDKAPNSAVLDPSSGDLALENGLSCINCHAEAGILSRSDKVRAAALLAEVDPALLDKVLAVYPEKAQFDMLVASDQTRYRQSLASVAVRGFGNGKAHQLNDAYLGLMSLADVAGVLGIETSGLQATIDATPQVFAPELRVLRSAKQPSLSRQAFDALFADLVRVLGLGKARAPQ
jgi:serine/threonine-protein kinase